jgi:hypothetical protein
VALPQIKASVIAGRDFCLYPAVDGAIVALVISSGLFQPPTIRPRPAAVFSAAGAASSIEVL